MHLQFFKRSFVWSLAVPCGVLLLLALLQSGLLQVFSVGLVTQDALVAGGIQSCLLALLMPWVLFLNYQEFWGTRSLSSEEMRGMLWRLYFKVWLALVGSSLGLYFVLRTFGVYFSGFSPLWILCFAALSLYGALWFAQNLAPDKRQWIYGFGVVILGSLLGSLFSGQAELIAGVTLGLLCLGTWLLWQIFPVSETAFSADTDLSVFLFYPLISGGRGLPKSWRRLRFMANSTALPLLVLLCGFLPMALFIWSVFWGGNHWAENLPVLQDYLDPVYPWLLVALLLVQVPSAYFWQGRREYWLTRPLSRWHMLGVSVGVHFGIYALTVLLGVVLCQAYTGYVFQGPFYALVLFFFVLGPALAFVTLLQMGLGLGGFAGLSYLLIRGDGLSYLLWAIAFVGWGLMLTRSSLRTSSRWLMGLGVALAVNSVLFYSMQQDPVLQAAYPRNTNTWDYRQQSRIETYLTHVLWLDVPRHEVPFAVADAVLMLDNQPDAGVNALMQDTLYMLQNQDILAVPPEDVLRLWEGDLQETAKRLQYWRSFAPQNKQWLAFEHALQKKSAEALAEAQRAYQVEPSLQHGLQWAYLQRVFLQEEQAWHTYQDLLKRYPESRASLLLQQAHLLAWGCQPEKAQHLYRQARQSGVSLSLSDLERMGQAQGNYVMSCVGRMPLTVEGLKGARYFQRTLNEWSQLNPHKQLYVASQSLFLAQNSPEILAYFKTLLRTEDFAVLQAKSRELSRLWEWARQHGVMNPNLRRTYSLLPAIFEGKLLTPEERQHYPNLLNALDGY